MEIDIPKFDPTLGVLQSIDFKLSVDQEVRYGVNDLYDPETGVPYEVTVTGGISATALPINVQNEQILSLESNGAGQVSQGSYFFENFISTSGTDSNALDLAAFEGTGNIAVLFQPFASAMVTSAYDYPFAGLVNITEYSSTLDITYNYVSAVPEPRGYSLLLGLILIGGVVKKLRPTQI